MYVRHRTVPYRKLHYITLHCLTSICTTYVVLIMWNRFWRCQRSISDRTLRYSTRVPYGTARYFMVSYGKGIVQVQVQLRYSVRYRIRNIFFQPFSRSSHTFIKNICRITIHTTLHTQWLRNKYTYVISSNRLFVNIWNVDIHVRTNEYW